MKQRTNSRFLRPGFLIQHFARVYVILALLFPAIGLTQTTQALESFDQSSPRSAARKLSVAVERGNVQPMRDVLLAEKPLEQRVIDLLCDLADASRAVREASEKLFGEDAGGAMTGDTDAFSQIALRVDDSLERITDESAVLTDGAGEELTLKLVDGLWRVPVNQIIGEVDDDVLTSFLDEGTTQVELLRELARELDEGKFRSAQEAEQVMHARMMRGTTQPAVAPPANP